MVAGPGERLVQDSGTPLRAVKVPEEECLPAQADEEESVPPVITDEKKVMEKPGAVPAVRRERSERLRVLVAEDDPINSKIMKKRLEKAGHAVHLTVNGEECASVYVERAESFDVVLMDMQVCHNARL